MSVSILTGDCRDVMRGLPEESVHCVVTSPPYWGLRCYGVDGQLGQEPTLGEHVEVMVEVFREVRRVLRKDGTLWLNYGDCYAGSWGAQGHRDSSTNGQVISRNQIKNHPKRASNTGTIRDAGLKPKDLLLMPARVALALQQPYYTGQIKQEADRIWLAAMIDGEGCMFIHKRKIGQDNGQGYKRKSDTYSSGLEVSNTSRAIVERCMEITGQGSICEQSKDRKQILFRWNLRSNECRKVVQEIYPHLVAKKHQARLLIGCPSSGEKAATAHQCLIALHNGGAASIDFPEPATMWEPGWYLRSEIIWSKKNPMPESVTDRPTSSHEKIYLLAKSARYFFDADAVRQAHVRVWDESNGGNLTPDGDHKANGSIRERGGSYPMPNPLGRNIRNVWTIPTAPFPGAHFATFPPALIEPCIKAGCPEGGTVLDPFGGAGTTGLVADRLKRDAILIELNPDYAAMARERIQADGGMFAEVGAP